MITCHPASRFLDLSADEDEDDDEGEDSDDERANNGDLAMNGPSEAQELVRGGRAAFASCLDNICRQYEGSAGRNAPHAPHNSPRQSQSAPNPVPVIRVYKVNILLGMNSQSSSLFILNHTVESSVDYI